jgi:6-pyruvoyltetrahydropterin/6-carboxytetrahydropterin synthase
MNFELKQHFNIESARFLPYLPDSHPCARMHGHSFKIILRFIGPLDPNLGWVMDYNDIYHHVSPLLKQLDHRVLNSVEGLENPTTEILTKWIYDNLKTILPILKQVTIMETPSTECSYPAFD